MANVPVQTCTPSGPTAGNGYTTTTCSTNNTTDVPGPSCVAAVATSGNGWTTTTCNTVTSVPALVASCAPVTASAANTWTATTCVPAPGDQLQYTTTRTVTTTQMSGGTPIGVPVVTTSSTGPTNSGSCFAPLTSPPLTTPNPRPSVSPEGPNPPSGCTAWPCTTSSTTTGGSINSLADVAQYYYITDLRPGMPNTGAEGVPAIGAGPEDDRASWQHMTTFTIALGVSGTLNYRPDYRSAAATTGDFADIRAGTRSWPLWPDPAIVTDPGSPAQRSSDNWNNPRSIDDFWHAAVNGRGQYFSAGNPASVVAGLSGALAGIQARLSSGAAAGTSSTEPVAGDRFVFLGSYTTSLWTGDVIASEFNLTTGAVNATPAWSAQAKLDAKTSLACDNRSIYLIRPGATNNLVNFSWNTRACDTGGLPTGAADTGLNAAEMAEFGAAKVLVLSQYPEMSDGSSGSVNQRGDAAGANMVNFLRGQRGMEDFDPGVANKLYRHRDHVLGDVVGGQPVYVKAPFSTYQDAGYQAFKTANSGRAPMVYVAANDGMLHALYAGANATDPLGGQEAWAVIPTTVLPNLYRLSDNNYRNVHQFFVDGTPVVGDVRGASASSWRSLLVGGLNAGGKGYYALDVTDPAAPRALWEFKFSSVCYDGTSATAGADCHLGLTFGKPVITKIRDAGYAEGRWVVAVTSGYNNVRGAGLPGDGRGYLYLLDAITGQILHKIDTGAGNATTPSNLGQLNSYVDDGSVNNSALRIYGGDMLGNVWRFDVNDTEAPGGREATLVGQALDAGGNPQPITTRPELAELNGRPMVFVATGRLLGTTDVSNTQSQSIYGIVDLMTGSPVYANLRTALKPMVMTQTGSGSTAARTVACSTATADAARCLSDNGWVVDLPDTGERVNIDMQLVLNTLVAGSNVPTASACSTGGYSWLNYLDFATGTSNGSFGNGSGGQVNHVSEYATNSLIVGLGVIRLPNGQFQTQLRTSGTEGTPPVTGVIGVGLYPPTPAPRGKRISWREIAQ